MVVLAKYARSRRQAGVTLIELLIAILIISVAMAGLISLSFSTGPVTANAQRSAQAAVLASTYLEEISGKPFADPDAVGGESNRAEFDDIFDYHGLDEQPPRGADGAVLPGLTSFRVSVTVANTATFGPTGSEVPAADAALITVRVRSDDVVDLSLHMAATR